MPSGSSSDRKSIDNEDRKRKHSKSSSVSSGNSNSNSKGHDHGKKKDRSNLPREEDRARGRESPSSTEHSNSQASMRNSDRSNLAAGEELPTNVLEAEDLITHQNQGNRQPLSDSPSPPHTPPRREREKSLDSFSSLSGTQSQKLESNVNKLRMGRVMGELPEFSASRRSCSTRSRNQRRSRSSRGIDSITERLIFKTSEAMRYKSYRRPVGKSRGSEQHISRVFGRWVS